MGLGKRNPARRGLGRDADRGGGRPADRLHPDIDPAREETHYWGDCEENLRAIDLWIGEAGDLGKGYGTQMMRLAIERCFADPKVTAILIDPLESNVRARRFYERLGFVALGPRRFGTDDCVVYRLGSSERTRQSSENRRDPDE
jgi:aminoglycoside 6'-N-acetyltransferase